MTAPKTQAEQRAKRLPTKAEREVLLHIAETCDRYTTNYGNGDGWTMRPGEYTTLVERAAFRRLARELRARAEGKKEGWAMKVMCDSKCKHVGTSRWPHETRLGEDAGEIHTDDCGFFRCTHDHDPGECCTSGQPRGTCRVRTKEKAARAASAKRKSHAGCAEGKERKR